MTSKYINWNDFEKMKKDSETVVADFERIKDIEKETKELKNKINELDNKRNEIEKKYKQEYTKKLNDRLDTYGILTVLRGDDQYEGYILSVTDEFIKIRYTYQYGSYTDEINVPTKELKEKGYYKYNDGSSDIYIVDKISEPLELFEVIKWRLKKEVRDLLQSLNYYEKEIKESTEKVVKLKQELKHFEKVSDGKITGIYNDIKFGVTDLKIEDVLKSLPREICIYKTEDKND